MNRKEKRAQRAKDFKNQKIQKAKDFNFSQHDPTSHSGDGAPHISRQEINSMKRQVNTASDGKNNVKQNFAALQAQKEAGAVFSEKSQNIYNRMEARVGKINDRQAAKEKAQAAQTTPPANEPQDNTTQPAVEPDRQNTILPVNQNTANQEVNLDNSQEQNVNQDNDINTDINGDDNYVVNNQDNSIRQYGGDNRSMIINHAGGGSLTNAMDGVGTAGTLGGMWDVDDSPAAQAQFFDMHSTMQRDAQKKYQDTSHIANGAVKRAQQNSYIDPAALDARIRARTAANRDRADVMQSNMFGNKNTQLNWTPNAKGEPVKQPDFEEMADAYTDF